MKKLFALVLALVMVMSLAATGFAQEVSAGTGPASITISNAAVGETYKVIKLFDATVNTEKNTITYSGTIPNALQDYFEVTDSGITVKAGAANADNKLTEDAVKAIKAWAETQTEVTASAEASEAELKFTGLEYGYYVVTTTQGTVITVTSTNPSASIIDKNTAPGVNKEITGASSFDEDGKKALAQVGTDVTYTSTITVGAGAKNYVYHDTMEDSLKFNGVASVTVTVDGSGVPATNDDGSKNYTVTAPGANGETFTVTFENSYIAQLDANDTIIISYSAKVTSAALTFDSAKNTAYVSYGDKGETTKSETEVFNAEFSVNKTDASGNALAGAKFVIKNSENKYYKLVEGVVTWVDAIDDADVHESGDDGKVAAFTGLANGTYTLVEKEAPAGYNKAADSTFEIKEHDYTSANLVQSTTVENKSGTELPSTGGMGTTLFYVVGGIMVLAAVVLLVTKKRMAVEG